MTVTKQEALEATIVVPSPRRRWLWSRKGDSAKVAKMPLADRETVIVIGQKRTWLASLPTSELQKNVDQDARIVPERSGFVVRQLLLAFVFALIGVTFSYPATLLWFHNTSQWGVVIDGMVATSTGGAPAALFGFWLGRRNFRLFPFWIVKRYWNAEAKKWDIYPVLHSSPIAQVHRADFMYDAEKMLDEKDLVKGGRGNVAKLEFAAMLVLAGCLVAGVILFALATNKPVKPTHTNGAGQTTQQTAGTK